MASWKENKVVGIVAGIVFLICVIILVTTTLQRRRPVKMSPEVKAQMEKVIRGMQQGK